ncbi:MAG TPA: bifunctional diguanylate cyclase/phosphodiesterase [Kineosporiaceae bacterium]|nr:bifunctional diguanylate cyclase/phosphodiesterase [Kineosporiaceae bacterium]
MHRTADVSSRGLLLGLAMLALAVPLYLFLPLSEVQHQVLYQLIAGLAVAIGFLGLRHHRPQRRRGWFLLLLGASGWVVGDLVWAAEQSLIPGRYPAPSDAFYLSAYVALGAGALMFVRGRSGGRDVAAFLDAAIVTVGAAVLVGVFLVVPLAADSSLSLVVKVMSAAYPLADLFLLGVIARMYSAAGARTASFQLLAAALTLTLVADSAYEFAFLSLDQSSFYWIDCFWLIAYLLLAAAACVPSMKELDDAGPDRSNPIPTRGRLLALAGGLMLPGAALLVDGATDGEIDWPVIGIGTLLLSGLVLFRMDGLLNTVQDQSVRLTALARSDFLTGAPNRRTWDHELPRACKLSRERDTTLCVAILDLDRFKAFNDSHGHQAGDRLLQDAVKAWTEVLPAEALLARYGGEEFAVLMLGLTAADLVRVLHRLRSVTPGGQTFSAGVAVWDPHTEPGAAVASADEALYAAKRAGRDRIFVHGQPVSAITADRLLPAFTILTQPIIDVATSSVAGHEALARFTGLESHSAVEDVFRRAHAAGDGDLLELAAIRAAIDLPGRPQGQDLFVNVSARAIVSERFIAGLPIHLSGVVVELSEDPDGVDPEAVLASVAVLRARGARIALDDVGAGSHEFARLATLRPDVLKVDRSLVAGCSTDAARTAVLLALLTYAHRLDLTVCAEGVEEVDDLLHLAELGVTHVQGLLLAAPGQSWSPQVPLVIGPNRFQRPSAPETVW